MGFDAWFFSRLDYKDLEKRTNDLELEWIWRPNVDTLGKDVQIFTHTDTTGTYYPPPEFGWEIDWGDPEWRDNNGPNRSAALMPIIDERISHYRHNHLFILFGCDFCYKEAEKFYRNLDHMIEYMNENHGDKYHF